MAGGMRFRMKTAIVLIFFTICFNLSTIQCTLSFGKRKQFQLQNKETNTPNFIRLLIMRLIFGLAKSMGLADRLSGFLGGIFVPPGADDYDYGDDYGGLDFGGDDLF
ncbi:uncharacterized protein LOC107041277 [Diachasma alloeum]|uniref:uncharacterized protein LOC107041277 n=1 Tax=Diachasma alloeum TaxID=454923 RepID=UPI0007382461|nr:uncharacterized protein LOC107041277 [Diachasma alloeum]